METHQSQLSAIMTRVHWYYALGLMWSPFDSTANDLLEYYWETNTAGHIHIPAIGQGQALAYSIRGYMNYRGHRIRISRRVC